METSWENSAQWYDQTVGKDGHYYHQAVIIPKVLQLLHLTPGDKILDLGCGQGILARAIPAGIDYLGFDLSPSLIKQAKKRSSHRFLVGDATQKLPIHDIDFSHAVVILALQNIESPLAALKNIAARLKPSGKLLIVLNHPCFRIPRQSSWGIDIDKKLQYRRIDSYLSPMKIPIATHPGETASRTTWSFHHSLQDYSKFLSEAGFAILSIEEWVSDKTSTGAHARMENRSRKEVPLFMAFLCHKK
jgi:ubiquinone/menaquinone biosynthesis C-methylase UbiE